LPGLVQLFEHLNGLQARFFGRECHLPIAHRKIAVLRLHECYRLAVLGQLKANRFAVVADVCI